MARTIPDIVTVTTAGTRVQLSSISKLIDEIVIQALSTNTTAIYIGGSGVSDTDYGYELTTAGDHIRLHPRDISDLWIDAKTSGEGVSYIATVK